MSGILYGVGVGVGDSEMITLKALEVIKSCDIIAVPDSRGENVALGIVQKYIDNKELLYLEMPMTKDEAILKKAHEEAYKKIAELLKKSKKVAFLTLGDPTIYSTYMYIHKLIIKNNLNAEIISGITSFCYAAGRLSMPLVLGDEPLFVVPAASENIDDILKMKGTKVIMKLGRMLEDIKTKLKLLGLYEKSHAISRAGFKDEKIYKTLDELDSSAGYFSIIIIKDN